MILSMTSTNHWCVKANSVKVRHVLDQGMFLRDMTLTERLTGRHHISLVCEQL